MSRKHIFYTALIAICTSVITVFVMRLIFTSTDSGFRESNNAHLAAYNDLMLSGKIQRTFVASAPTNFSAAAAAATPAVVNVKAINKREAADIFGDQVSLTSSNGSGVIISPDGYIITNNHVIQDASEIYVTLNDKREVQATLIGKDMYTDVAVLKIPLSDLMPAKFGNSDSLRVGEWVLAVGNPFNLQSTVTAGIVSAKARSINILEDDRYAIEAFIQSDAVVNPGNSGGALVNTNGELVGINTAIMTKSGKYEGYSFAIPVNLVMKIVRDIIRFGVVQRGFLGVEVLDLTTANAKRAGFNSMNGVQITFVSPRSSAEEVGLRRNDIITAVQGRKIKNKAELMEFVAEQKPGDVLDVEYFRDNKTETARIVLKNKNNSTSLLPAENKNTNANAFLKNFGISNARTLTAYEMQKLKTAGVKVIRIDAGSLISRTNMDVGFVITHLNNTPVNSSEELQSALQTAGSKIVFEGIYEDFADTYYYKIDR